MAEYNFGKFGLYDTKDYADRGQKMMKDASSTTAATKSSTHMQRDKKKESSLAENAAALYKLGESTGANQAIKDILVPKLKDYMSTESPAPTVAPKNFGGTEDRGGFYMSGGDGGVDTAQNAPGGVTQAPPTAVAQAPVGGARAQPTPVGAAPVNPTPAPTSPPVSPNPSTMLSMAEKTTPTMDQGVQAGSRLATLERGLSPENQLATNLSYSGGQVGGNLAMEAGNQSVNKTGVEVANDALAKVGGDTGGAIDIGTGGATGGVMRAASKALEGGDAREVAVEGVKGAVKGGVTAAATAAGGPIAGLAANAAMTAAESLFDFG